MSAADGLPELPAVKVELIRLAVVYAVRCDDGGVVYGWRHAGFDLAIEVPAFLRHVANTVEARTR